MSAAKSIHQQISQKVDCASLIHPTLKQSLPANMPVKILVEDPFEKNEEVPVLGEDYSFLKVAMQAKLRGPKDFSENINDYLKSDLEDRIVPLSIQLSPDEEALLEAASR